VFRVDDCARIVGDGPDEPILEAARGCPTEAISVIDSQTGEQVYP
jgi:ferredoxin